MARRINGWETQKGEMETRGKRGEERRVMNINVTGYGNCRCPLTTGETTGGAIAVLEYRRRYGGYALRERDREPERLPLSLGRGRGGVPAYLAGG